jgi:predicted acyltransferase
MFYSLSKHAFSWNRQIAVKVSRRVAILFALGLLLNLLNAVNAPTPPRFALMGDLQYIAVAYGLAVALILWLKRLRFMIGVTLALTVIYYTALFLLPVPVILRTLSYLAIALAGYVTATLCYGRASRLLLSLGLFIVGLSCFLIGSVWEQAVPTNTTFLFKLMSYPWMCYACLIFLIDVCKWTKWTYPFVAPGRNALVVYLTAAALDLLLRKVLLFATPAGGTICAAKWFYEYVCAALFGNTEAGSLCYALVYALLVWLVAWLLYRRNRLIKA